MMMTTTAMMMMTKRWLIWRWWLITATMTCNIIINIIVHLFIYQQAYIYIYICLFTHTNPHKLSEQTKMADHVLVVNTMPTLDVYFLPAPRVQFTERFPQASLVKTSSEQCSASESQKGLTWYGLLFRFFLASVCLWEEICCFLFIFVGSFWSLRRCLQLFFPRTNFYSAFFFLCVCAYIIPCDTYYKFPVKEFFFVDQKW